MSNNSNSSSFTITGWIAISLLAIGIFIISYNKNNSAQPNMSIIGQSLICLATISISIGLILAKSQYVSVPSDGTLGGSCIKATNRDSLSTDISYICQDQLHCNENNTCVSRESYFAAAGHHV